MKATSGTHVLQVTQQPAFLVLVWAEKLENSLCVNLQRSTFILQSFIYQPDRQQETSCLHSAHHPDLECSFPPLATEVLGVAFSRGAIVPAGKASSMTRSNGRGLSANVVPYLTFEPKTLLSQISPDLRWLRPTHH